MLGAVEALDECLGRGRFDASGQHLSAVGDDALGDGQHLLAGLALAENDFWEPGAQGAMMINVGKPEVLKRQVPKPI